MATSSPRTSATARTSRRHINGEAADPYDLTEGRGQRPNGRKARIERRKRERPLRREPQRQRRARPEKQGRDCKDDHEESGFRGQHRPEDADIPDRREPRPIDHDAADAREREEEDNDGDQHADASRGHAPPVAPSAQRLTAASVLASAGVAPRRELSSNGTCDLGRHCPDVKSKRRPTRQRRRRLLRR